VEIDIGRRMSFASHRLVGWIFWDPFAIERYASLGVPNGAGYYIASRAAPLAAAGDQAVIAAFGSIHPGFVAGALQLCREHASFAAAAAVRDEAVVRGLAGYAPEIVDGLAELAPRMWEAGRLALSGRPRAVRLASRVAAARRCAAVGMARRQLHPGVAR
jgi:hypothetical protein